MSHQYRTHSQYFYKKPKERASLTSEEVDEQIKAFLESGGEIQKVGQGVSGDKHTLKLAGKKTWQRKLL